MLIREEVRARREMHKLFQSISLSLFARSMKRTLSRLVFYSSSAIRPLALLNEISLCTCTCIAHVISLCTCRGLRPEEISDGKRFVSGLRVPTCTVKNNSVKFTVEFQALWYLLCTDNHRNNACGKYINVFLLEFYFIHLCV